jgi:hypothetical protein
MIRCCCMGWVTHGLAALVLHTDGVSQEPQFSKTEAITGHEVAAQLEAQPPCPHDSPRHSRRRRLLPPRR